MTQRQQKLWLVPEKPWGWNGPVDLSLVEAGRSGLGPQHQPASGEGTTSGEAAPWTSAANTRAAGQ